MPSRMPELRRELTLIDDHKIIVKVFGGGAAFECETCGDVLDYVAESQWWQCAWCEYELTANEAAVLVDRAKKAINVLDDEVRVKGGRWKKKSWWSRLFH